MPGAVVPCSTASGNLHLHDGNTEATKAIHTPDAIKKERKERRRKFACVIRITVFRHSECIYDLDVG